MDTTPHTNYTVRYTTNTTAIDYKKTSRDWFNFVFNILPGLILTGFSAYLFYSGKHLEWKINTIIGVCCLSVLMLIGLAKLAVAFGILFSPTKSFITIHKFEKTITVKFSYFRTKVFPFDKIKLIQLSAHDTNVKDYFRGQTYKRQLYYHQLSFLLTDERVKKIHTFTSGNIFIPVLRKTETYEVSNTSKQIAKLIAAETGIKYTWLGTKKQ